MDENELLTEFLINRRKEIKEFPDDGVRYYIELVCKKVSADDPRLQSAYVAIAARD